MSAATEAHPPSAPGEIDPHASSPTLLDPDQERQFRERGYAVLEVLPDAQVAAIRAAYQEIRPPDDQGLSIDYIRADRTLMAAVAELTRPLWEEHLPRLFVDHRCAFTTFVTKHPGPESDMFLHEDRSFVDERTSRAGTLWIPLVDVGPDLPNGGIQLVPGSPLLATAFSGSNTPEVFRPFERPLRDALVTIELRAGQAVFYDTRTLHASPANTSPAIRDAIACAVVRRDAELVHVVATGRRRRRLFAVEADFFIENHPREIELQMPPTAVLREEWDEDPPLPVRAVGELLGLAADPVVEVQAPWDAPVPVTAQAPVETAELPETYTPRSSDLGLAAADLPDLGGSPSRHRYRLVAGAAGRLPVDRSRVLADRGRRWLSPVGGLVPRWVRASEADVLVVDPGGRLVITVDASRTLETYLDVVEAPLVGAGMTVGSAPHHLDLGRSFLLPAGTEVFVWSDGPGPLAVAVTMVPTVVPVQAHAVALALRVLPARRAHDRGRSSVALDWFDRHPHPPGPGPSVA